ncbi:response regulator [bacterium]|nr:response regulator [bacterium]
MKKVLIIEDEKDIAEIIKMSLELEGFKIETALNGFEGLEKIESFGPDIIVLDIIMEGMDGMTMKKRMKKDIPVIVASACDKATRTKIESEIKVNSWLEKPFEIDELVNEVKLLTGGK